MANDCIPYYRPGEDITARAGAAVTGKRVVACSVTPVSGPGLATTAEGSNVNVIPCAGATLVPFGVAKYDQATVGGKVGVIREGVVPITAGGTVTAGQSVMADSTGRVITYVGPVTTTTVALPSVPLVVGVALNDATVGLDCMIALQLT